MNEFEHTIIPGTFLQENKLEFSTDQWKNYSLEPCDKCGTIEILNMNIPEDEEDVPNDRGRPFVLSLKKEFKAASERRLKHGN